MKRARILARGRMGHQQAWGGAFAAGLERHGWQVSIGEDYAPADLVCLWGVRRRQEIERAKQDGAQVCILERGYVGDRHQFTSVSFGGELNGRAEFRGPAADSSRWEKYFSGFLRPYDPPKDGYALIMGQVPGDMSLQGCDDIVSFYQRAAKAMERGGWQVRFRAHPLSDRYPSRGHGIRVIGGSLADAVAGAGAVITWNSNSGVDAALAGRPVIAMDAGSMAWPIAGHGFTEILTPDRSAWAHRLAWCQWTADEMRSGECWGMVG